jgi:hypothetical protein
MGNLLAGPDRIYSMSEWSTYDTVNESLSQDNQIIWNDSAATTAHENHVLPIVWMLTLFKA